MTHLDIDKPEVILKRNKERMTRLFLRGEREVVRTLLHGSVRETEKTGKKYRRLFAILESDHQAEMKTSYLWHGAPGRVDTGNEFPGLDALLTTGYVDG
jgi:hypothetical protein